MDRQQRAMQKPRWNRAVDVMPDDRAARDYGRDSGNSNEEKIKRYFPGPDRRFHDRLTVVAGFARNRATGNVHAFARNDALLPRLLAQLFELLFGWRIGCHEKNANARSDAMIDAIAIANAEVHDDFS